ncbi:FxsA family protein [Rhodovibrionaceae bacterium A322]
MERTPMGLLLLFLFIAVPLIEIALFIQVGDLIGLWPTLAVVIITAVLGSWQLRVQGFAVMSRARSQMDQGQLPAKELFDGFCLMLAGILLLTPGFFTDSLGFLLFLSPVRNFLRSYLSQRMTTHVQMQGGPAGKNGPGGGFYYSQGGFGGAGSPFGQAGSAGPGRGQSPYGQPGGPTIDGDFEDVTRPAGPGGQPGIANENSPWHKDNEPADSGPENASGTPSGSQTNRAPGPDKPDKDQ